MISQYWLETRLPRMTFISLIATHSNHITDSYSILLPYPANTDIARNSVFAPATCPPLQRVAGKRRRSPTTSHVLFFTNDASHFFIIHDDSSRCFHEPLKATIQPASEKRGAFRHLAGAMRRRLSNFNECNPF